MNCAFVGQKKAISVDVLDLSKEGSTDFIQGMSGGRDVYYSFKNIYLGLPLYNYIHKPPLKNYTHTPPHKISPLINTVAHLTKGTYLCPPTSRFTH